MDTFDFVVVGGGSGGCTVAGRLSEDPQTSVALLDAGGKNDNWVVTTPFALALMVTGTINNWAFNTVPQAGLNGRVGYQPRGKGLGGSSAINAMVYIRGHRSDYDQWADLGNPGWSFADVLPYFKRSEDNADFDGEYHGKGGPLAVNRLRTGNPVHQIFLQAAQEAQFRLREDFNAEDHEGLGVYQVTQKNGERWSAARAYIHPHMNSRANLRVEVRAQALFGLSQHPAVALGQVPLILVITSPAGRSIQTTRDLPGFWAGSWRDVAKEMRGRYPKHSWPDDPAAAAPTLRTKRASQA